jgi:hypothetical protein
LFLEDAEKEKIFKRNYSLIELVDIPDFKPVNFTVHKSDLDKDALMKAFTMMEFTSMTKEKSFNNYVKTFETINNKII